MRTIWKYDLPQMPGAFQISMPAGKVISVGLAYTSRGNLGPVLWAEVNPDTPDRPVDVVIEWTGQPMTEAVSDFRFIGTVVFHDGELVQHVYVKDGLS